MGHRQPFALVAAVLLVTTCGQPPDGSPATPHAGAPRVTASIRVGAFPSGVAVGGGAVWVAGQDLVHGPRWGVVKVDQVRNEVVDSIRVPDAGDVAFGGNALWVEAGREIVRIDPKTVEIVATIHVGRYPVNVAYGLDAVWVTLNHDGDPPTGSVVRIDPITNEVVARIPVNEGWPRDIAIGEGAVWVSGPSKAHGDVLQASSVWRIDPGTNRLAATVLRETPQLSEGIYTPDSISVGNGAVWAAGAGGDGVRIDPATNGATSFPVEGRFTTPFMALDGSVWYATTKGLGRIDSETLEVVARYEVDISPIDVARDAEAASLWVANYQRTVTRVDLS
jgi:hypothetical protein